MRPEHQPLAACRGRTSTQGPIGCAVRPFATLLFTMPLAPSLSRPQLPRTDVAAFLFRRLLPRPHHSPLLYDPGRVSAPSLRAVLFQTARFLGGPFSILGYCAFSVCAYPLSLRHARWSVRFHTPPPSPKYPFAGHTRFDVSASPVVCVADFPPSLASSQTLPPPRPASSSTAFSRVLMVL